jgi:glucan phosphoethanolaminetransferase (alkaline phosphatase superfamily)
MDEEWAFYKPLAIFGFIFWIVFSLLFVKIGLQYNFPAFIIVFASAFFIIFAAVTFVVIWFPQFRAPTTKQVK